MALRFQIKELIIPALPFTKSKTELGHWMLGQRAHAAHSRQARLTSQAVRST